MFGYESWVKLNGIFIPATQADTDVDRARIDSQGIYGGGISGFQNIPIGNVHYYDWPNVTANFTAEATPALLSLLKEIIASRTRSVKLEIISGQTGGQTINYAWWNQITVSTGEDSLVAVSVNFIALEREEFTINDIEAYWTNRTGSLADQCFPQYEPIPFWDTEISEMEYVKSWSLSLSQDVSKFQGCMNYSGTDPKEPFVLGCGIVNGTLNVITHENSSDFVSEMPTKYSGSALNQRERLTVQIGGSDWLRCLVELNKVNDPVASSPSLDEVTYDFQIYGLS